MEPQMIVLKEDYRGIPKGTKGTIVFEYRYGGQYEVEFIVNGESLIETLKEENFFLFQNIIH
jgi:hypothetical protein